MPERYRRATITGHLARRKTPGALAPSPLQDHKPATLPSSSDHAKVPQSRELGFCAV
jgi:hypothetical protein